MPAYISTQQSLTGYFVPTSIVFDVNKLYEVDVNSDEFKDLLVILYQNVTNMSLALNAKDTGYYLNQEFVTGRLYFNPNDPSPLALRPGYRKVVNIGTLPAGEKRVPHGLGIDSTYQFVDIYGAANDSIGKNYYPLSFASATGANNIELRADIDDVVITNNSGIEFDSCMVTLEYVKF